MLRRPLLPLIILGVLLSVLPVIRWEQLPDPDFYPRNTAFALVTALLWLVTIPVLRKTLPNNRIPFAALPVVGFLVWTLFRTSFEGPSMAIWFRWCSAAFFVLSISSFFKHNPQTLPYLPRILVVFNLLLLASFCFQFVGSGELALPVRYDQGGWAGNKNYLSEALFIAGFFLMMGWNDNLPVFRILIRLTLSLSLAVIVLLQTVSVWFAVITVALSAFFWISRGRLALYRRVLVLSVLIVTVAATYKIPAVSKRVALFMHYLSAPVDLTAIDPVNDNSVYERFLMYRNSFKIVSEHPIAGCGVGRWSSMQAKYGVGGTRFLNTGLLHFEHPHNEYLLVLSESGLIGLVLLVLLLYVLLRPSGDTDPRLRWSFLGLTGALSVALFAYPLSRDLTWFLFLLHAAVWLSGKTTGRSFGLPGDWRIPLWSLALTVTLVNTYVMVSGMRSEFHLGQSAAATLKKEHGRAIREARAALTYWYSADRAGTPVDWYIGDAAFRSGDASLAALHLKRARAVDPFHPRVLNDLGTVYEQTGHPDSAVVCYQEALRTCPGLDESRLNMAATYFNAGDVVNAHAALASIRYPDSLKGRDAKTYREFLPVIERAYELKK